MWGEKVAELPLGHNDEWTTGPPSTKLGRGLRFQGDLVGSEDLYIDGEAEGTLQLDGSHLTVGPNGRVRADVVARVVTVLGHLEGEIRATERAEIRKTGSLRGNLVTAKLAIEEGAEFRGSVDIVKLAGAEESTPPIRRKSVGRERIETRVARQGQTQN
jgi:cytoskeletal protein CcmA (bactofilin family)